MLVTGLTIVIQARGNWVPVLSDEADTNRDRQGIAWGLCRCFRNFLGQREREGIVFGRPARCQHRCACLAVPPRKGRHIDIIGIRQSCDKIITGDSISIMTFKIEIRALAEPLTAKIPSHHTDDLGALFIHCRGVEIIDLAIGLRADRMGGRAPVLWKLRASQETDITGPLYTFIMHVG